MTKSAYSKTETYEMGKGFMLDVVEERDTYEAWIWRQGFGVKDLAFGVPKSKTTKEEFIDLAEQNFTLHAKRYVEAYA